MVGHHVLARIVGQLGHRLAIAAHHLDDDGQWLVAQVVGEVGADAEAHHHPLVEAPVQRLHQVEGERIGEHQRLGGRIDPVGRVVPDQALAPLERIARIVPCAVEELAEVHVEVAQERIQPVHVRQRDAQVAAVLARPSLEGEDLRITQPRPQRLAGLQVLMRHRSQRPQPVAHRQHHVRRAGQHIAQPLLADLQHLLLPARREAPARAVVGNADAFHLRIVHDGGDLLVQPPATLVIVRVGRQPPEVQLVDDGQHRDLEEDGVQPRPLDDDIDLAVALRRRRNRDVLAIHLEKTEKVDEIALEEAELPQVVQLLVGEAQRAQRLDLALDVVDERHQVHALVAALEAVLHLCPGEVMQHHLHHRELVQVGIK